MRYILPSDAVRSTGRKRPVRLFMMWMRMAEFSASKSCRRASFWQMETGKKPARVAFDSHRSRQLMRAVRADDPEFLAEIRREGAMMRHHPENDAIDDRSEEHTSELQS